ncbi:glycoside hydrolase family 47 protein [Aspergillus candidus]|uniref:alpha-1,2-Mannosidase n=1 Tax=Aspergillus candidus TaxID=41067 RepID=A0A2I2F1Z0_ASPCN|nr:mannosyl-oligosaccharide 1,2-alpha-mannosidase IC [Aspergillus candidus]PLB34641.1 mannosyl-oligosaccharide 1,2-alpha-mannosidase IC [Aspergillus candidus]
MSVPSGLFFRPPIRCPITPPSPPYSPPRAGFSWRDVPTRYPVDHLAQLPHRQRAAAAPLPRVQHDFTPLPRKAEAIRRERQAAVKRSFQRAWKSYETHAWKKDELAPLSGTSKTTFGGWGATLVDNLDTLLIMGLQPEFERAVAAIMDTDFRPESASQSTLNLFEITIRYLGGFLSAYDLTDCRDTRLLDIAVRLGDMIYASFDTPTRMPITRWNPHAAISAAESTTPADQDRHQQFAAENGIIAELASSSLEFTRLSQLTGDMRYYDAISRITDALDAQQSQTLIPGLWPVGIDVATPDLTTGTTFSFGAMADSAFEYLGKTHQLLAGSTTQYKRLYERAMSAGIDHLLFRPRTPDNADILIPGTARASPKGDTITRDNAGEHLTCFVGGMYALGGKLFNNDTHVELGRKLTDGCVWLYRHSPTGIMPESFALQACPSFDECDFPSSSSSSSSGKNKKKNNNHFTSVRDKRYALRPEAIESVFYLYRITGDESYRDDAWEMFTAIDELTRTPYANAALLDVTGTTFSFTDDDSGDDGGNPPQQDSMESFWMAETLKYFYLVFSEPDVLSLDEFVFNTEAHPFRL